MDDADSGVPMRLAELIAALSPGIDLGFGNPKGHGLRQSLIRAGGGLFAMQNGLLPEECFP